MMTKVLITRPKKQSGNFGELLEKHGIKPIFFPTVEIAPPRTWTPCIKKIKNIDRYSTIIFTSSNGARFFLKKCMELTSKDKLANKSFVAIGTKTTRTIKKLGFHTLAIPEKTNSLSLINKLTALAKEEKGAFLYPHGSLTDTTITDSLRKTIRIEDVVVYRTIRPSPDKSLKNSIWRQITSSEIDGVAFFSPSSVRNFLYFFPKFPKYCSVKIFAFGDSVAKECEKHSLTANLLASKHGNKLTEEFFARLIAKSIS
jgi:uroporphyrinogen III methyltransferase/synthase